MSRYLAASMLACFPTTALLELTIEDRHDSTPVLLRRAISFIDDNAADDISLTDIARAVYVSPRALQYMFRKHRDCTPMEYLRQARLHHVRLELMTGNRLTTTVGQVAARLGFGHLGRFATAYRLQYGESPHQTLRR
ncbi:helix-turn-helix transcriptional regulator [Mycobacterium yunnanensis]|uniref:Helix-turn-helix transcriptional regulator n=1 Tax=Mycobacterium yunnanensis TaxID=368477 RepID=A0A9X2YY38_9MYCO|nr:helix-turn-helix transcriptional regulator [Mycobacterium yunnanensis]MCV7420528.1 helix-turn-helix transcriptional regulator [Mycobacterium yunnanensis]